jgi:hypothetical protein
MAWPLSPIKQSGAVYLTLNGASNGATPTSISWTFEDANRAPLRSGHDQLLTGVCGRDRLPAGVEMSDSVAYTSW